MDQLTEEPQNSLVSQNPIIFKSILFKPEETALSVKIIEECPKIFKCPSLDGDTYVIPSKDGTISCSVTPAVFPSHDQLEPLFEESEEETLQNSIEEMLTQANTQCEEMLGSAQTEAAIILQNAKAEAEAILQNARAEAAKIKEEAYSNGLKSGEEKGYESVKATLAQAQGVLKSALDSKKEIIEASEPEIIKLILSISKKIIRKEVSIDKNIIVNVVSDALQKLGRMAIAQIRLNPADIDVIKYHWGKLSEMTSELQIMPDEMIAQGGCVITSQAGNIDAKLDTQFDNIATSLLGIAES